jgi:dihydrofolate reductase
MRIGMIWAQARDAAGRAVIGHQGQMPWHLPEDLAHFRSRTMGCPVIMGRKTWDSLPPRFRPLPGRLNTVVTRNAHWPQPEGVQVADSLEAALAACEPAPLVWIMGGGELYAQGMAHAHELSITHIDLQVPGDTFAPELQGTWCETERSDGTGASGLGYSFRRLVRD